MNISVTGATITNAFISERHEAEILAEVQERCAGAFIAPDLGRLVLRFGWDYPKPRKIEPAPRLFFAEALGVVESHDAVTVNVYFPGVDVTPHIDDLLNYDDIIHVLSLGCDTTMTFVSPRGDEVSLDLPRRSLLTMSGAARSTWQHGVEGARAGPRVSVVYRRPRKLNADPRARP